MSTEYQPGYKLRDLQAHIEQCVGEQIAQQLHVTVTAHELIAEVVNQGHGYDLFTQRYLAVFTFEGFPFNEYLPATLFANFIAWLMDNDPQREKPLTGPQVSVTTQSDTQATIVVTVPFEEAVKVIEDDAGGIIWRGKQWRIEQYPIDIAEKIDVIIT
jgi:hypothetical protein